MRYLRIAVTTLSLTACVLLVALWVRSYWWCDVGYTRIGGIRYGASLRSLSALGGCASSISEMPADDSRLALLRRNKVICKFSAIGFLYFGSGVRYSGTRRSPLFREVRAVD